MRNNILSEYKQNSEVTITYSTLPLDSYVAIRVSPKQQVPQQQTKESLNAITHNQHPSYHEVSEIGSLAILLSLCQLSCPL